MGGKSGERAMEFARRSGTEAGSASDAEGGADRLGDARPQRGSDTRQRLIEAALDVFGRLGFEGATTRQIAKQAGVNLAAIVYHFGSKEALHMAVAEHIVTRVSARVGAMLAAVGAPEASATPQAARTALMQLIETFAETLLGEAEAERWARFIVREQMQPTPAFDVIYRMMGNVHALGSRLVATILGRDEEDEEVKLKVFTLLGQLLVFRVAQELVLRRTGWRVIGEAERTKIKRMATSHVDAILGTEAGAV